jgi:hypothetical protein
MSTIWGHHHRITVQQYSEEESSFLEDIKHGFIYGSQDFINDIKARFLLIISDLGEIDFKKLNIKWFSFATTTTY